MVRWRRPSVFVLVLLLIEFVDELAYGTREAAWPLIRDDLNLTYTQIGLLLSLPLLTSNLIEPVLGILGDVWRRRWLVLGGGVLFTLALLVISATQTFWLLLTINVIMYPASGAFVNLAQASLMDSQPSREEQNMARWTLVGSVGVVSGPLLLGAAVWAGPGWRGAYVLLAVVSTLVVLATWPFSFPSPAQQDATANLRSGLADAINALRRREVWRWLTLLQFSNLLLDILHGYLALYFVDVAGTTPAQAGLAVLVWTGASLIGDAALIPLLEHVRGVTYLHISAALELILFPAMLLAPGLALKLALLALVGLLNAGWYAIPQGQLYRAMPGQSGTVMAVNNVGGLLGSLIPLIIGLAAQRAGLGVAIWLVLAGPVALLVGLPRAGEVSR